MKPLHALSCPRLWWLAASLTVAATVAARADSRDYSMKPQQQRKRKRNYGVAAYDWPFDSVRAYILNLNTQRASLRAAGKPLTALALVGTLSKYSKCGQAYVDTLTGIIKQNKLDVADDAALRDDSIVLIVGAEDVADKAVVEQEIAQLGASGELNQQIQAMRLQPQPHRSLS